ncbi:rab11 family-interacting protein 3 isoform X2 [Hoplias malabaricus]|uniref:rab11 family-interacting protein 3 isoform X2 n=1 Tax=Hoplias malabaricus TaxID=27720 RepID=UPI0034620B14
MEQVLSSPRGHSDWESDQNSLGFLLLDMDNDITGSPKSAEKHQRGEPGIVSLSFDEIFQENAFNLDDLFRASRYSGLDQPYSWEQSSECVSPQWDKQPVQPQELTGEGCCDASGSEDTGDLISFNSTAPSPIHTGTSMQATRQDSPVQVVDLLQPILGTDSCCSLDGFVGQPPLEPLPGNAHCQSVPLERTTVEEQHLDSPSRVRDINQDSSQSSPEQAPVDFADVLDLSEAFSLLESSEPPDGISFQKCDRSCALPLIPEAEFAQIYLEQETALSVSNIITDFSLGIQARTQSPVNLAESGAKTGLDSLILSGTQPESMVPGASTDGPVKYFSPERSHERDETLEMEGQVEKDILSDVVPKNTPVHDLDSVLGSLESVPEEAVTLESISTSCVSLSNPTDLTEVSRENEDYDLNTHTPKTDFFPETPRHLEGETITCNSILSTPCLDDIQNTEPFESEMETLPNSSDAPEDTPSYSSVASVMGLLSVSTAHTALEISPEPAMDPTPETEALSPIFKIQPQNSHSDISSLPKDTRHKQTINTCLKDIEELPQTLGAGDIQPLASFLHTQETLAWLFESGDCTNLQDCKDLDGNATQTNQVPNLQETSEDLSICDHNCECPHTKETTTDEYVIPGEPSEIGHPQSRTEDHIISENDNLNEENFADTHIVDTDVPFPAPGGLCSEVVSVQEEEKEDRDNDQDHMAHSSESVTSHPDSTPLSGADCQLTQLGVATPNWAEVREELRTDLPVDCTQADQPQVTHTLPNLPQIAEPLDTALPSSRDESPGGVCPLEETCTPLMEENTNVHDVQMALDLLPSSDKTQDGNIATGTIPVPAVYTPQDEDPSALRAVFQALDQDGDGFVRIEEFMEFATAYGAEQVKDLTRFLDPSGLGVISFEDFHRGITAISNGGSDPDLYRLQLTSAEANGAAEEYDEQAEVSDSAYLGSESAYSECETFTDEDTGALVHPELHEDVETDSGIENTLTESEDRNRFSLGSDLHGHALVAVIGGEEEQFEDFGESNSASDLLLANQEEGRAAPEGEGDPEPHPHPGSPMRRPPMLLSPSSDPFSTSFQSFLQSESLEFFCTHCHKQISRLEDLSTRLHLLEMNSSSKRLSSKKAAMHLLQSGGLDGMSDLSRDILDLADSDITDKVLLLERRVCELEKDSAASEEQHARLRQENLTLVHRANALEEQLKEQELHSEENLQTLARRHRDTLSKLQRERDLEIENLQARLHQLDEENSELRSCVPCLRANIERLEEEKRKLQDEVEDVSDRLNEEMESRRKMSDKLSHERHSSNKEKENTQELIEDLRKQLEHLQLFKLETEARRGRLPGAALQEYNTHMRENELEQEIRRLKQDNRCLKEQNDELNGQIINLSIQGAKSLFTESLSESLASEINNVSRAELMEAIQKQEEINFRLQDYIDRIIVAIMESNPSILEVK